MKTNLLLNLLGLGSRTGRQHSRVDSVSIVSRQSDLRNLLGRFAAVVCMLLTLGIGNAWGALQVEYNSTTYTNGQTIQVNIDLANDAYKADYISLKLKASDPGFTPTSSCYIDLTLSNTNNIVGFEQGSSLASSTTTGINHNGQYGNHTVSVYYRFDETGDKTVTLEYDNKNYMGGTSQQKITVYIKFHVTRTTPTYTITYHLVGVEHYDSYPIGTDGSSFDAYFNYASGYTGPLTVAQFADGFYGTTSSPADMGNGSGTCYYTGSYTSDFMVRYNTTTDADVHIYLTATPDVCNAPTVNNTGLSITYASASSLNMFGGQISNKGGGTISEYGWVRGTSHNPTGNKLRWTEDIALNTSFGTGKATSQYTGLTPGATYYIRAYAVNSCGETGYGPERSVVMPYNITLNANGGGSNGGAYAVPNETSLRNMSSLIRSGYLLEGYYTTSACTTKIATSAGALQPSITVSGTAWTNSSSQWTKGGSATFYAKWTPRNYTVTLDGNSATSAGSPGTVTATYNANTLSAGITNPSRTGYTFGGWNTKEDGTGLTVINTSGNLVASQSGYTDASANWIKTTSVTLYAKWIPNEYTVQWKVNGVLYTTGTPSSAVNHGEHVATLPTAPNPATYCSGADVFIGWTTAANGTYVHGTSPLFTTAEGAPTATGNQVFHAVFADYE